MSDKNCDNCGWSDSVHCNIELVCINYDQWSPTINVLNEELKRLRQLNSELYKVFSKAEKGINGTYEVSDELMTLILNALKEGDSK